MSAQLLTRTEAQKLVVTQDKKTDNKIKWVNRMIKYAGEKGDSKMLICIPETNIINMLKEEFDVNKQTINVYADPSVISRVNVESEDYSQGEPFFAEHVYEVSWA